MDLIIVILSPPSHHHLKSPFIMVLTLGVQPIEEWSGGVKSFSYYARVFVEHLQRPLFFLDEWLFGVKLL